MKITTSFACLLFPGSLFANELSVELNASAGEKLIVKRCESSCVFQMNWQHSAEEIGLNGGITGRIIGGTAPFYVNGRLVNGRDFSMTASKRSARINVVDANGEVARATIVIPVNSFTIVEQCPEPIEYVALLPKKEVRCVVVGPFGKVKEKKKINVDAYRNRWRKGDPIQRRIDRKDDVEEPARHYTAGSSSRSSTGSASGGNSGTPIKATQRSISGR